MNTEKKKDNVIGIGHNQKNDFSKEHYARLMNAALKMLCYAKGMVAEIEHKFDEAFTKHINGNSWDRKLKDFEIHEKRISAKNLSNKCYKDLSQYVEALEERAKVKGIEIEESNDKK